MYDDKSMEEEMQAIGYARQSKFVYEALWSTMEVEHFIFFSLDSSGYFGGRFGLRNPVLEEFGIDSLIRHGHRNFQMIRQYRNPRAACTLSFEFGRFDNFSQRIWPRVRAGDKTGAELASISAKFVRQFVFPIVRRVGDLNGLLDFLIADEEPTPWLASGPATRAAQVVALARKLGIESDQIRSLLDPHKQSIAVNLMGKKIDRNEAAGHLDRYMDQLLSDLAHETRWLH